MSEQEPVVEPSPRELQARQLVGSYANWSLAPGLLPTPVLDIALLTGIQLRMLSQLSKLYGVPFSRNAGKSIIAALLGSVIPTKFGFGYATLALKTVPVVGNVLGMLFMPAFAWATTHAIGKVFIHHFESGGTMLNFDPSATREHFRAEFEEQYASRSQQAKTKAA